MPARRESAIAERVTLYEQETVIVFNRADAVATVETHEPSWIRSLRRRKAKELSAMHFGKSEVVLFEVPKSWIRVQPKRIVSPLQREAAANRFAAHRRSKSPMSTVGSEDNSRGTGPNPGAER